MGTLLRGAAGRFIKGSSFIARWVRRCASDDYGPPGGVIVDGPVPWESRSGLFFVGRTKLETRKQHSCKSYFEDELRGRAISVFCHAYARDECRHRDRMPVGRSLALGRWDEAVALWRVFIA